MADVEEESLPSFDPDGIFTPEYLAALPEDAPLDHDVWMRLKNTPDSLGNPLVRVNYRRHGVLINSQVTGTAAGSMYGCFRIARRMWIMYENGHDKDEVVAIRNDCCGVIKQLLKSGPIRLGGAPQAATVRSLPTASEKKSKKDKLEKNNDEVKKEVKSEDEVKREVKSEDAVKKEELKEDDDIKHALGVKKEIEEMEPPSKKSKTAEAREEAVAAAESLLPPDVPADHASYSKMRVAHDSNGVGIVLFKHPKPDGGTGQYQMQLKKFPDFDLGMRFARHLYFKIVDEGCALPEANALRAAMYKMMAPYVDAASGSREAAPSPPATSSDAKSGTRIRTRGDVKLEDVSKPNEEIPKKQRGRKRKEATEEVGKEGKQRKNATEADYDVNEVLPEDAPADSDAYTKVGDQVTTVKGVVYTDYAFSCSGFRVQVTTKACLGNSACAQRIARLAYVKAAAGATKKEVIDYRDELYRHVRKKVLGESAVVEKPKSAARSAVKAEGQEDESTSDTSGSDSNSSDSNSSNDVKSAASDASKASHKPIGRKAVAKMAVRSGLRCPVTFALMYPKANGSHVKSS